MKYISVLGITGSIGRQTVDVVLEHPEEFRIVALSAGHNITGLKEVLKVVHPQLVCVKEEIDAYQLSKLYSDIEFVTGDSGLIKVATHPSCELVVNALVGFVGLVPTISAIHSKKTIALANKETLVVAGKIVTEECRKHNVQLLPIDSEHSAILQCLRGNQQREISKLLITASGGSFRDLNREQLKDVTKEDALKHPNWSMGAKITIDSATMMNKGFEVIEAHWLFDIDFDDIEVIMHKESIIHSLVEYRDGAIMAQLGSPDMRIPIQYALTYPQRLPSKVNKRLDLAACSTMHFAAADTERYPLLGLAYQVGRLQGNLPAIMNAANEEAVALFLQDKISFLRIEELVLKACSELPYQKEVTISDCIYYDQLARDFVRNEEKE